MSEFYLRGSSINRFRFLLEQDYPFEKALRLTQDTVQFQLELKRIMLAELKASGNPLRLAAVQDEDSDYSQDYRLGFERSIEERYNLQVASDFAEKLADTGSALTIKGNPCRPEPSSAPRSDKICLAVTTLNYPLDTFEEWNVTKIRTELRMSARSTKYCDKPHILECTWVEKLRFMRVVCGDRKSVKWLTGALSKLKKATNSFRILSESKLRKTNYLEVTLSVTAQETIEDILGDFQSSNTGFDTTKWKVFAKKELHDKTSKLILMMPAEPDVQLLRAENSRLKFRETTVKFHEKTLEQILNSNKTQNRFGNNLAYAAYTALFPVIPTTTRATLLKSIKDQNKDLNASEWSIAAAHKQVKNGQNMMLLTFAVHYSSDQRLKKADRLISYNGSQVQAEHTKLKRVLRMGPMDGKLKSK